MKIKNLVYKSRIFWMTLELGARIGFVALALILVFGLTSSVYQFLSPKTIEVEKWKTAEVTKWKTKRIVVPIEVVVEKEKIIEKLGLPEWVKDKEILSKTEVSPHEGKTDVVTTLDPSSGKVESVIRQYKRPALSLIQKFYVGVDYSPLHSSNQGDYRLFGELEAGRLWSIKPYIRGEIDDRGNYRASAGIKYEF